ncbi:hypothetical protein [Streptomyces sp. NPDC005374]|uniref:CIS tube protein n=1 Tax=Streptomyces sp. NPDC005374 TaxID=3364713 RepID=UPI0036A5C777
MSKLVPATIQQLKKAHGAKGSDPPGYTPDGDAVEVQFNPTSLRLQYQNTRDIGGKTVKTVARQYFSVTPAVLSFDLEYDSAEEVDAGSGAGTNQPFDVRRLTAAVRHFARPGATGLKAPPVLRFSWGQFAFDGIVTQITEELDYFAPDGTPLRAKLSISVTEQDPAYEGNIIGPGGRDDKAASVPGNQQPSQVSDDTGTAPGHRGTTKPEKVETAQDGESAQQLAARIGGDPAAWRSLMNGLQSPLGLPAGAPVQVGPELTTDAGVGRAAGYAAGVGSSVTEALAQALGLAAPVPSGPAPAGAPGALEAAGFALSQAGGIARAVRTVTAEATGQASAAARAAFAAPAQATVSTVDADAVDPRSLTYGRAIPLRTRVHPPTLADIAEGGRRSLAARARPYETAAPDALSGPAPWQQLPPATGSRARADREQRRRDARPSTMRWKPAAPGGG